MSWKDRKDKKGKRNFPFDLFEDDNDFFGINLFKRFQEEINYMIENSKEDSTNEVKHYGPYVWGYNITIGPDGIPYVKQFGNVPTINNLPPMNYQQLREKTDQPLVDIFTDEETVKLIIELPGINKEDIHVKATESKVSIEATSNERHFSTEKDLQVKIKPKKYTASYNNGVLELIFDREIESENDKEEFEVDIA